MCWSKGFDAGNDVVQTIHTRNWITPETKAHGKVLACVIMMRMTPGISETERRILLHGRRAAAVILIVAFGDNCKRCGGSIRTPCQDGPVLARIPGVNWFLLDPNGKTVSYTVHIIIFLDLELLDVRGVAVPFDF